MIKKTLKTISTMAVGGAVVLALTYNSKMVDIKAGIDSLKQIAIEHKNNSESKDEIIADKNQQLEELEKELEDLENTLEDVAGNGSGQKIQFLKEQIEKLKQEIIELENANSTITNELQKANAEIEKANAEQIEILNYVNQAIEELK